MSTTASSSMTAGGFLAAGITLSVFTAGIVTVRLAANFHQTRKLQPDDYLSVIAVLFLAASFGLFYELDQLQIRGFASELDPRPAIRRMAVYAETQIFLSGLSTWTAKLPVLVLLIRIFGIYRCIRVVSIITIVVLGFGIIAADIYNAVICKPPSLDDDMTVFLSYVSRCTDASSLAGYVIAPLGLAADVIIFILPIPFILQLQLSLDKKIGLAVVFLIGIIAVVGSAISMKYKFDAASGKPTDIELAMVLTLLETAIVIAAGCVPAVKAFWAGFIAESGWYTRLTSLLSTSNRTSNRGPSKKSTKRSQGSRQKEGSSTENINEYYKLEDQHSMGKWANVSALPLDSLQTQHSGYANGTARV
ncbi:hypothetical protein MFIFM68171_10542 [Madurella fahalii]|uniref:Rhodopsin domain-containing protein n=1 Tax=Madurella fahalii TaxID=1157608 RepID=A0ABQ0GRI5_9PEZI